MRNLPLRSNSTLLTVLLWMLNFLRSLLASFANSNIDISPGRKKNLFSKCETILTCSIRNVKKENLEFCCMKMKDIIWIPLAKIQNAYLLSQLWQIPIFVTFIISYHRYVMLQLGSRRDERRYRSGRHFWTWCPEDKSSLASPWPSSAPWSTDPLLPHRRRLCCSRRRSRPCHLPPFHRRNY